MADAAQGRGDEPGGVATPTPTAPNRVACHGPPPMAPKSLDPIDRWLGNPRTAAGLADVVAGRDGPLCG